MIKNPSRPTLPLSVNSPNNFQTPPHALLPLYPYLKKDWKIWEPAWGEGNIVRELTKQGYDIFGTDIEGGADFLDPNSHVDFEWDCIVTNPPYSIKDKFLERCYSLDKPFALLMPLTALEGIKRQALYRENGVEVILMDKRINFETPYKVEKSSSWFATAWFTWKLNIGSALSFYQFRK